MLILSRHAFRHKRLICTPSKHLTAKGLFPWYTSYECKVKKIDIEPEFPGCEYLFRCLLMTGDEEIRSLVFTAKQINRYTSLLEIARLFRNLNTALKRSNPKKAERVLEPLANMSIFPIVNTGGDLPFDQLAPVGDHTSWFIADREHLRRSFVGRAPLLAFSMEELGAMDDLFEILRIDSRKLSKLVKSETIHQGMTSLNRPYTKFLRDRVGFMKAYESPHIYIS